MSAELGVSLLFIIPAVILLSIAFGAPAAIGGVLLLVWCCNKVSQ